MCEMRVEPFLQLGSRFWDLRLVRDLLFGISVFQTAHLARRLLNATLVFTAILGTNRLALAQAATGAPPGTGNGQVEKADDPPPTYRRIFVDAKRLAEYPTHGRRFLPVTRVELDRLLRISQATSIDRLHQIPRIESVFLTARLGDDRLLEGVAQLDIVYRGSEPRLLDLSLGRVSARDFMWVAEESKTERATFGTFGTVDTSTVPRQSVLVEAPGKLAFSWSKAGRHDSHGSMHFDLPLIPCHRKSLALDLPTSLSITVDNGLVTESSQAKTGRQIFEIALGGSRRATLQIRDATSRADPEEAVVVRQSIEFDVDAHGAELEAEFQFAREEMSTDPLWLECGKGVHVYRVVVDDSPAKWWNHRGASGNVVEIVRAAHTQSASPKQKAPVSIRVHALVEQPIGKVWRVPSIRISETRPLRSSVVLHIAPTLEVAQIEATDAVQISPEFESRHGEGWQLAFEERSPNATIDITLRHHAERRQDQIISIVTIGERESISTTVVDVTAGGEAAHVVMFPIGDRWLIDTVNTVPKESLRDWFVRRDEDQHRLVIYPEKVISGRRPLRIVATGRRYGATLAGFPPSGLRLLAPPHEEVAQERLFVRPDKDRTLREVPNANSYAGGPAALGNPLKNVQFPPIFGLLDDRLLFPVRLESEVAVAIESKGLPLEASIRIDAIIARQNGVSQSASKRSDADRGRQADDGETLILDESLDIECTPQGAEVHEVIVDLSGAAGADVTWRLVPDGELLSAQRVPRTGPSTFPHIDQWQIQLPAGQTESFRLHGHFEIPYTDRVTVGLASVSGFTQQRGRVDVHSPVGVRFQVFALGMDPIPPPPGDRWSIPASYRSFEFDPANSVSLASVSPRATLTIQRMAQADPPTFQPCFVRLCRLDVAMTDDGSLHHAATLFLENVGSERFVLRLPVSGDAYAGGTFDLLESITVDGRPVSLPAEGRTNTMVIDLPPETRLPVIGLHYVTRRTAFGWRRRTHLTWPAFEVPVLDWQSSVYLPPQFEAPKFRGIVSSVERAIAHRLFGLFSSRPSVRDQASACLWQPNGWTSTVISDWQRQTGNADAGNLAGWTTCRIPKGVSFTVVRRNRTRGLAVFSFFAAAALVAGAFSRRAVTMGVFTSISVCAALLLPDAYVPIATASLLGGIGVWFGTLISDAFRNVLGTPLRPTSVILLAATVLGAIGSRPAFSTAAEPSNSADVSARSKNDIAAARFAGPHEVLIPTGSDRQPTGDTVLITDHFYRLLLDRARKSNRLTSDWTIERARYSGRLARDIGNELLPLWSATWDVVTFRRDATVWLPIAKEDATWHEDATLDGSRIGLEWSADGMTCRFNVAEPGNYQVVFRFEPKVARDGDNLSIDMRVPQVADAAVLLGEPNSVPDRTRFEIDGGARQRSVGGGQETLLENARRLSIRWQVAPNTFAPDRLVVEPFYLLHITPEATHIDVLFRIEPDKNPLGQILVKAPNNWRFVEPVGSATVVATELDPDDPSQRVVRFSEPKLETTDVVLRFDVLNKHQVGILQIGHAAVRGALVKQSHWGMNLDPRLQWDPPTDAIYSPEKPETFTNVWPTAIDPPQIAYLVPEDKSLPVAIWPRPAVTRARESNLVTLAGSRNGTIEFQAEVKLQEGECFGHSIDVPPTVDVESVRVVQGEDERDSRWVQDESGSVNVFAKAPLRGRHSVVLRGSWHEPVAKQPHLPDNQLPARRLPVVRLPVIRLIADDYESAQLVVRRQSDASVAIFETTGVEARLPATKEGNESASVRTSSREGLSTNELSVHDVNIGLADYQYDSRKGYDVQVGPSSSSPADREPLESAANSNDRARNIETARGVTDEDHTLVDSSMRDRVRRPQIVLADLKITGLGAVDAEFLLLPAEAVEIGLHLPDRCVPTYFDLAGRVNATVAGGANRWRISLRDATSPILLRVLYQMPARSSYATHSAQTSSLESILSRPPPSSGEALESKESSRVGVFWSRDRPLVIEPPVLLWKEQPIPIRRTIWAVAPLDRGTLRSADPTMSRLAGQVAAYRWMSLCKALRAAQPFAQELRPDLRRDWFIPWARRLVAAESATRVRFEQQRTDADLGRQINRAEEEVRKLLRHLELTSVYNDVAKQESEAHAVVVGPPRSDRTGISSPSGVRAQFFALDGTGALILDVSSGTDSFVRRFAAAALLVLIVCGMAPVLRFRPTAR